MIKQYFVCRNQPKYSFEVKISQGQMKSITLKQLVGVGLNTLKSSQKHKDKIFSSFFTDQYNQVIKTEPSYSLVHNSSYKFSPFYFYCFSSDGKEENITISLKFKDQINKFYLNPQAKLSSFKKMIENKLSLQMKELIFQIDEKDLRLDFTLEKNGVREGTIINCIENLIGSGVETFEFVSMDESLKKFGQFKPAPPYRIVSQGTNIEGKCDNPKCKWNTFNVIAQMGLSEIDINNIEGKIFCPSCKFPIKCIAPIFVNCKYNWRGFQEIDGKIIFVEFGDNSNGSKFGLAPKEGYVIYDSKKEEVKAKWTQLFIRSVDPNLTNSCGICQQEVKKEDNYVDDISCMDKENHFVHHTCQMMQLSEPDQCVLCCQLKQARKSVSTNDSEIE